MLKNLRAWALALATLACAPAAAYAACTTPSLTGLTGLNASQVSQTLATVTQSLQQMPLHIDTGWNGSAFAPLTTDSLCNLNVNIQAGSVSVSNFPATQPVSGTVAVSSLPALPTGANPIGLVTGQGAVTTVAPTYATGSTQSLSLNTSGGLRVDGSGVTQPVSGSVSVSNFPATQPISAASLPLPAGAATAANQPGLNADGGALAHVTNWPASFGISGSLPAGSAIIGAVGNAQGSTTAGQSGPLVQGAVTSGSPTYTSGQTSPLSLDASGNLRVNVVAGGGSGGTSSTFGAAFPSTGTAIGAKSGANMVNLAADGSNNLLVNCAAGCSSSSTGYGAALPANGQAIGANVVSSTPTYTAGNLQAPTLDTAGNLRTTLTTALPAGANAIGSVSVSNFPATQPVSASSLPLPTGAATAVNQTSVQAAAGTSAGTAVGVQGVAGGVAVATKLQDSGGGDPTDTTFHAIRGVKNFVNPSLNSTLTLGATAAYQMSTTLCASTCTPSSIYFVLPNGNMSVTGGVIRLNDSLANSWGINAQIIADLWSSPVTLSNGDGGAYKIATGTANYLGSLLCTSSLGVQGDGVIFKCNVVGSTLDVALGSANAHLYATFSTPTGSGTPTAGSTLAMTLMGSN